MSLFVALRMLYVDSFWGTKNDKPCHRNCTTLSYLEASSLLRNKESDLKYRTRSVIPGRIGDPLTGLSPIRGARTKKHVGLFRRIFHHIPPHLTKKQQLPSHNSLCCSISDIHHFLLLQCRPWTSKIFGCRKNRDFCEKKKWFSF